MYQSLGIDILAHKGDESYKLPIRVTYIVQQDGSVVDAFVNADYSRRLGLMFMVARLETLAAAA